MSYPPTPPPLPPQRPIPVRPLEYTATGSGGRPGILTAVAILSICFGVLGLLTAGATLIFTSLGATALSRAPMPVVTPASAPTTAPGARDEDLSQDGMPSADRARALDAFAQIRPMSAARRAHLDALLAEAGKKILPLTGDALTPRAVVANVTDAGQYPSGTNKSSAGADYFVLARGRIEVSDHHAVFRPAGLGQTVRAAAPEDAIPEEKTPEQVAKEALEKAKAEADAVAEAEAEADAPPTTSPVGLTDRQIDQIVAAIEKKAAGQLTPAQATTLRTHLRKPDQTHFVRPTAPGGTPLASQVTGAVIANSGLTLSTPTGYMTISPTGTVTGSASFNFTAAATPAGPAFAAVKPQIILAIAAAALSTALALYLIVCGIFVLRDSPHGRRLHLIYAYAKITLSLAGIASWAWFFYSLLTTSPNNSPYPATWGLSVAFALPGLLSLIYPIALLIIFHTRTAREYYSPANPG